MSRGEHTAGGLALLASVDDDDERALEGADVIAWERIDGDASDGS